MTYRQTLEDMKDELQNDTSIKLIDFTLFNPVEDQVFADLQERLDIEVVSEMQEFYKSTNGLQVRWQWAENSLRYEREISASGTPFPYMWPAEHYWQIDGVINILPIEKIFFESYKNFIWFDFEKDYEVEWNSKVLNLQLFKKQLRPMDIFDKYYTVAIHTGDDQLPLLLGDDHNADFTGFAASSFKQYFDFLVKTRGEVAFRPDCFSNNVSSNQT